jgi:hypothetical protein
MAKARGSFHGGELAKVPSRRIDFWQRGHCGAQHGAAAASGGVLRLDKGLWKFIRVHVSAFLSGLSLTTNRCGSARRHRPARDPRSPKPDAPSRFIVSQGD